jgi:transcription factor TFIIIB component B''
MKARLEAKKCGLPLDLELDAEFKEPELPVPVLQEKEPEPEASTSETADGFDYSMQLAPSRFNVQVRIGPNGETILDEDSLVVDRVSQTEHAAINAEEGYTHVTESEHTKFTNSGTYGKRFRGSRWSREETELFYDVSLPLSCVPLF